MQPQLSRALSPTQSGQTFEDLQRPAAIDGDGPKGPVQLLGHPPWVTSNRALLSLALRLFAIMELSSPAWRVGVKTVDLTLDTRS